MNPIIDDTMHTTNYFNTFIEVADDCTAAAVAEPPRKGTEPTAANIQYELLVNNPYEYTSDDVLFQVHAIKNKFDPDDLAIAREQFFSRGQPCFRASPLPKRYGWGVHSNADGRIAIYPVESEEYARLAGDKTLCHLKAMRSRRG